VTWTVRGDITKLEAGPSVYKQHETTGIKGFVADPVAWAKGKEEWQNGNNSGSPMLMACDPN
jgi:hypothetical protein